jgi:hypothetical protein
MAAVACLPINGGAADRTPVSPSRTVQSEAMPELDTPGARLIEASGDSPT